VHRRLCVTPTHCRPQYTGTIDKSSKTGVAGKQFDSSRTRGQTFDFPLGAGRVIAGWDKGLVGLCVGAKAILTIPPELGYGSRGAGADIPADATLSFEVEVMGRGEAPPEPNLFKDLDTNKDTKLSKEEVLAYFKKQGQEKLPDGLWDGEDKDGDGAHRSAAQHLPRVTSRGRHPLDLTRVTRVPSAGFITWEEFGGPKGKTPPKDEL
jgi:hypothetical protein